MTGNGTDAPKVDLSGRVAIVTGAGGGIGRAHALALAARGAHVVVNDPGGDVHGRDAAGTPADRVVEEILAAGGSAVADRSSVATPEGGATLVEAALSAFGTVDAVVHNAGVLRDRSFAKLSDEDVDVVLDVHLRGAFNVLRPAYAVMREHRYGRILLTTSASGLFGTFGQTNYAAAKMGLIGLMNVLALEGASSGITVNAIAPTASTRMTEGMLGDLAGRFDPEHVATLAAYLVSESCTLTHRIYSVGGGRIARAFVGVAPGWYGGAKVATPEEIAANIDAIDDLTGFVVPDDGGDELRLITEALGVSTPGDKG